jgi:membrane protease YdiL (CAAX protease family)
MGGALFGTKWALPIALLVAVVFGYGHIWQDLAGAIVSGVGGPVFGLTYVFCQRRHLPAMTAHAVGNVVGIMDIYLYGL